MYWNTDYEQAIEYRNGWIVTLDVLKLYTFFLPCFVHGVE